MYTFKLAPSTAARANAAETPASDLRHAAAMARQIVGMVDHARHRAHDIKRHLGRTDERSLDRILLRPQALLACPSACGTPPQAGSNARGIGVNQLDQAASEARLSSSKRDACTSPSTSAYVFFPTVRLPTMDASAAASAPHVRRRPAPAGSGGRGCKFLNETGVYHQSLFLVSSPAN